MPGKDARTSRMPLRAPWQSPTGQLPCQHNCIQSSANSAIFCLLYTLIASNLRHDRIKPRYRARLTRQFTEPVMPLPANPARLDCSGRRVLITAGASGIGAAMAQAFAGAGARVHVCDMDQARIDEFLDANPGITATRCDVTDEAGVREMVEEAADRLGGLDALVNNAGISGPTAPLDETETPIWMQTYAVNVHGTFFTTRAALPHLR